MKYRNVKTGAVIETASIVSGDNWVEETSVMAEENEDAPFDEEIEEKEEEEEKEEKEIPEKPTRKRGKKAGEA